MLSENSKVMTNLSRSPTLPLPSAHCSDVVSLVRSDPTVRFLSRTQETGLSSVLWCTAAAQLGEKRVETYASHTATGWIEHVDIIT